MVKKPVQPKKSPPRASAETLQLVRTNVRDMLLKSAAFRQLTPDQQAQIAHDTVDVCSYLAEPDGIQGNKLANGVPASGKQDPYAFPLADDSNAPPTFRANAAREGAAVAGALLQAVNFPTFVASLIKGVFHAIVQSSIEQMEAYGKLVADVAKTLDQFRDDNTTDNQARDQLVSQFPDVFQIGVDTGDGGQGMPRVQVRDDISDEDGALKKVNSSLPPESQLSSLDADEAEQKAVPAARTQLATSRQQLLATMVLMGINRIVVTDGKISAKVMYDFKARDNMKYRNSATRFDYDPTLTTTTVNSSYESGSSPSDGSDPNSDSRNGSYYAKGTYQSTQQPVLNLISASQTSLDADLQTKASLAGDVEVNFKSDYLPLEKMADSFQIGRIQDAAKPGARGSAAASGSAPGQGSSPAPPPNAAGGQAPASAAPAK